MGADGSKNTGESVEDGLGLMVVETVETAEGAMLLGESGPILDGVAVGAAEGVYVGLYMIAVLDGNAVGSKYVTDLN